ncbi:MAG: serine protease [Desulfobacteraceae bacterium]|nr:serine protease [Desulfobacteraceae bacterium]
MAILYYLVLLVSPAVAGTENHERIFSMPIFETEEVIRPWLENNGFELSRATQEGMQVQLDAETQNQHWLISLKAHSPLATRIIVDPLRGENSPLLNAFWEYLDGYVKIPDSGAAVVTAVVPNEVRNQLNAVVCIYSDRNGAPLQVSGFALDRSGLILTTAHDLKMGHAVSVRLHNGHEKEGRVIKLDADLDLCLIQMKGRLDQVVSLDHGRYLTGEKEKLFALSCAQGKMAEIQSGMLDGPPRRVEGTVLLQVRLHIEPGSSGSPILDDHGRLTGVVKGRFRGTNMIGFVIPFDTVLQFLGR